MKYFYLFTLLLCSRYALGQMISTPVEIKIDPEKIATSGLGLNDLVDTIEYVPLETKKECLIGNNMLFDFSEKYIIVSYYNAESALLFDRKGHFLCCIGSKGSGPNEFVNISKLFISPNNQYVIIVDYGKALYFNTKGEFLWSTPLPLDDRTTIAYHREQFLRMAQSYVYRDSTYYIYTLHDIKGRLLKESIKSISIPLQVNQTYRIAYSTVNIVPAYTYKNKVHVREYLNDTVYVIDDISNFVPKYIFNLGKYKVTPEIQGDMAHFRKRTADKLFVLDMYETSGKILIEYMYHGVHFGYYDCAKQKMYEFKNREGFPNDYDGGLDFVSSGFGQRNEFIATYFYADDIENLMFLQHRKKRKIEGPQSAVQAFEKLVKKVDPDDNPIIMIVKLKE